MPSTYNQEMEVEEEEAREDDMSESSRSADDCVIEPLEREYSESSKRKCQDDNRSLLKKRRSDSFQPPTVKELNQLRETENLFNSNLFRIQIEEMIKETQMKVKYQHLFGEWFQDFKKYVCSLKMSKEYDLSNLTWLKKLKVSPPLELKSGSDTEKFKFICPQDLTVGGSYSIHACLGPIYSIDLHIHMPVDCFQKSDQINLRFDRKRALYLAFLADSLISSNLVEEVKYVNAHGCPLKPVLELKPCGKLGKRVRVLIWPVTSPEILLLTRLRPGRGNIRSQWLLDKNASEDGGEQDPPSPHYNSGVAQDLVWKINQEMLESELSTPSLQQGLILLKIWLRQRGLDKGYGTFGGFIMSMFLVYLMQNKRLNKMMSSYQVARVTWHCLAQSDWISNGISLSCAANGPSISDFHKNFDVVFIDVSGNCNLCAHLRKEIYLQVKEESARAVSHLDASETNCFQILFLTPVDFEQSHEHLIRFHDILSLVKIVQEHCKPIRLLPQAGWILPYLLHTIMTPLHQGLGQRATLMFQPPKIKRWNCTQPAAALNEIADSLILGLQLNSSYAFEKLERGPSADLPEAEKFRSFWGEVSQLRRFKDGSICEAVLWEGQNSVCEQLVQHVLNRHVGLKQSSYLYIAGLPDPLLKIGQVFPKSLPQGNAAVQVILACFETLSKQLRSLSNITLSVNSVQGISSLFRYADVFPPNAIRRTPKAWLQTPGISRNSSLLLISPDAERKLVFIPRYCAPVEVVMSLEHSGKWPQNLEAVRRLKAAFCIQLANSLQRESKLLARAQLDHVDVLKDGFVFRIWLVALKEVALMKQKVGSLGLIGYHDTPESVALEEKLVLLPKISSSLHGLHQQFSGYGPTTRIAKRWLSSQLLGPPHIPDLVTELLVAYLFISPHPFNPPVQPQLGLLHFLRLVSRTDWSTTPIIVNLNSEFTREKIADLEAQFHSSRKSLPPLFICTPYDRNVSQFTQKSPLLPILIRLGVLASEALKELQLQCLHSTDPDCTALFRPYLGEYDVLITLKQNWINRVHERVDKIEDKLLYVRPYVSTDEKKIPIVDFDPIQCYLTELREGYSHCALFFHDLYGGDVIGVVWKPCISEEKDFKVPTVCGHRPVKKSKIIFNIDAILEDFFVIGKGLVQAIDNRTEKKYPGISSCI